MFGPAKLLVPASTTGRLARFPRNPRAGSPCFLSGDQRSYPARTSPVAHEVHANSSLSAMDDWPCKPSALTAAKKFLRQAVDMGGNILLAPDRDADGLCAGIALLLGHMQSLLCRNKQQMFVWRVCKLCQLYFRQQMLPYGWQRAFAFSLVPSVARLGCAKMFVLLQELSFIALFLLWEPAASRHTSCPRETTFTVPMLHWP